MVILLGNILVKYKETECDKDDEEYSNPMDNNSCRGVAIVADHAFLGRQRRNAVVPDIVDGLILLVVHVVLMKRVFIVFA